jgi:hypothetical protein
VSDANAFLADKKAICDRFAAEILLPIGSVFQVCPPLAGYLRTADCLQLAPNTLSIFWDHEGPLIAFNKGGALFCNA